MLPGNFVLYKPTKTHALVIQSHNSELFEGSLNIVEVLLLGDSRTISVLSSELEKVEDAREN